MPRFSSAVATLFTRFENFVFCLCIVYAAVAAAGRLPYRPRCRRRLLHLPRLARSGGARSQLRRGSAERYVLFGLDQLAARGLVVRHNLERKGGSAALGRGRGRRPQVGPRAAGGYGGDFATVLASLRRANRADVVFSTVDTVGIPLMLLRARGPPAAAARVRGDRPSGASCAAPLGADASTVCVRARLVRFRDRVQPVRGGRAPELARPATASPRASSSSPSVSTPPPSRRCASRDGRRRLGRRRPAPRLRASPPRRGRMPDVSFRIVTSRDHRRGLSRRCPRTSSSRPTSRSRRCGGDSRRRASSRCPCGRTATPGATTVLLQAMALGKPVVVTRTQAIATGYGLVDGENCRLVAPGDDAGFERALSGCAAATSSTPARSARAPERRSSGSSRGSGTSIGSRSFFATQPQHRAISVGIVLNPARFEVRRELGARARSPLVHLDEELADGTPGLGRRSEHDPALLALGVHLDDQPVAERRGPPRERPTIASTGTRPRADLVLRPGVRRMQRVRPGSGHQVQLGLASLALRRPTARTRQSAPRAPVRLGSSLEELEIRRVRLERDHDARAVRERMRPVVPLVRAEIENDCSLVVGADTRRPRRPT